MSNSRDNRFTSLEKETYAPLEKVFERIATPFEEFLHRQTTAGILLLLFAVTALAVANSPLMEAYGHLLHTKIGIDVGSWTIEHSIHHWINDGLMTLFFFVVGMEIKREILVGELSDLKNAALPVIAALGGMALPALLYVLVTQDGEAARGWGIPMATDIAFAVGVVALLGDRVPKSLVTFLVALAIVDDLGAVLVIALFYTEHIHLGYLEAGGAITLLLVGLNVLGIRSPLPYFVLGLALWIAMHGSGIHATVAGILVAFTVPAYSRFRPRDLSRRIRQILNQYDRYEQAGRDLINNEEQSRLAWQMDYALKLGISPLQKLESAFHIPSTYLVIPLFALANAAIPLDLEAFAGAMASSIPLAIVVGLLAGKLIGVSASVYLAQRLGIGRLPQGTVFSHIIGAGFLAGIGFTMSIFISELAFSWSGELVMQAKMGIFVASLVSGLIGYGWLRWVAPRAG